jgi:hypothetical protein
LLLRFGCCGCSARACRSGGRAGDEDLVRWGLPGGHLVLRGVAVAGRGAESGNGFGAVRALPEFRVLRVRVLLAMAAAGYRRGACRPVGPGRLMFLFRGGRFLLVGSGAIGMDNARHVRVSPAIRERCVSRAWLQGVPAAGVAAGDCGLSLGSVPGGDAGEVVTRLCEGSGVLVLGCVTGLPGGRYLAEGVVQGMVLRGWRYCAWFSPANGPVRGWLIGVARSIAGGGVGVRRGRWPGVAWCGIWLALVRDDAGSVVARVRGAVGRLGLACRVVTGRDLGAAESGLPGAGAVLPAA